MQTVQFSDQIAARINCYGIDGWLTWLAALHQKTFYDLFPIAAAARHEISMPEKGWTLTLRHPHAGHAELADPERWILESAVFDPQSSLLPFGLDAERETPDSAKEKLSNDIVIRNRLISYFLPDARVVELSFASAGTGLTEVRIVRLGAEIEFDEASQ